MIVAIVALVCFYMWLVVYSTYRYLEIKKGVIHEVHAIASKKYGGKPYISLNNKKYQRQKVSMNTRPYDV